MERDMLDILLDHLEPDEMKRVHGALVESLKANKEDMDDFQLLALIHRIEVQIMRLDGTRPSLDSY